MKLDRVLIVFAAILLVYMPLHVFLAQSLSLLTGGLDIWKAAKDVVVVVAVPLLLYVAYRRRLFADPTLRIIIALGGVYALLHGLFVLFDQGDDTYSAIVASVYNTRILGYFLLGYIVGASERGKTYLKHLATIALVVASTVAIFGVAQYFLPSDFLTDFGYSVDRGVKPLFFIDDDPNLPRVMSTIRDPNSLGAYLIVPILLSAYAFLKPTANKLMFIRPFRKETLAVMLFVMLWALLLTFSRGALLGLFISGSVLLWLEKASYIHRLLKKYWVFVLAAVVIAMGGLYTFRDAQIVQDYVFHAAENEAVDDPNEKRIGLGAEAVDRIADEPLGYGPGTAGLVSINNPQGGFLTENYYLQIAYEVGWLGLALFIALLVIIGRKLYEISVSNDAQSTAAKVMLASFAGYVFYSFFIHLWSNEAVALQWWLLCGIVLVKSDKILI